MERTAIDSRAQNSRSRSRPRQDPGPAGPGQKGASPWPLRLRLRLLAARLAVFWERLAAACWPFAAVVGLFIALALLDLLPLLPGWLHALLLVGFALALLAAAWHATTRLRWPGEADARRRLESDSGLGHRPLTASEDELAAGNRDPASVALWQAHKRRVLARLAALRAKPPRPVLAAADPLALRSAVVLLLVAGLVVGAADWRGRLGAALTPRLVAAAQVLPPSLDVWINPPPYTGQPPLFLTAEDGRERPIPVPTGSELLVQVQGGRGDPSLRVGARRVPFQPASLGAFRSTAVIEEGAEIAIEQGTASLGTWPIEVIPDLAPAIDFLAPPGQTDRAVLNLRYDASDDYGVSALSARVQRIDNPEVAPLVLELPLASGDLRRVEGSSYHDLSPHPWAGLAVEITLVARDAIGQEGTSEPARTVLPERIFNHPVARALVELRKQLTLDPGARFPVIRALNDLNERPAHYFDDIVVALAIRSAERRLIHDRSAEAIPEVQELLWETALRIEDGDLAVAERDLREIQEALMKALAEGASDEEIQRLMDQLEEALERYLEALAEQLQEQLAQGKEPQPLPPNAQLLEGSDLKELIERAREMAEGGARDQARELLAQLQEMLENLRMGAFNQMNQEGQDAWEMMRDMDELRSRQQELLDRSYQRSQQGNQEGQQNDGERSGDNQGDAQAQDGLRRDLGDLMRRLGDALGDIPRPLGRAEQSMRDARDALNREQPGDAIDPQSRALDQLQQGMEAMAERFMQQMGETPGQGQGNVGMQPGEGRDPLGRETGNQGIEAMEGVEIPDQMELRRSREILDELRRRRGERSRPPVELDYLDRLLKQF